MPLEINHAGTGGLWAELVSNRGFQAESQDTSINITPWGLIGDESSLQVSTDNSSCFEKNKIALKLEVLCDSQGNNTCPEGGVGVYNPGFWGMVVNFGSDELKLEILVDGSINSSGSTETLLTSHKLMDENSFDQPNKVSLICY
ncbi:hypothetical protein Patl1_21048 [Pistacia atlantica]|uniref:Uncharacterized protein n=1 Tax=Pistacia atlantica TaxID=434234 RepID=A0ACC1BMF3_9ROSI|nr:hypothetical protein Patl1_21048 [Pistacia atlantica]